MLNLSLSLSLTFEQLETVQSLSLSLFPPHLSEISIFASTSPSLSPFSNSEVDGLEGKIISSVLLAESRYFIDRSFLQALPMLLLLYKLCRTRQRERKVLSGAVV